METVTLAIALVACALVLYLKPLYGLMVYMAVLVWYPSYMTVPVGRIDFTVCRIVILAIGANLLMHPARSKSFKFIFLDKCIFAYFLCQLWAGLFSSPNFMGLLENRSGAIFDMVLPYFIVRLVVVDKKEYLLLLKSILIIAMPLAILGVYQCFTGKNLVGFMMKHSAITSIKDVAIARHGLFRANITFSVSIMFGLFFAMLGPSCAGLLKNVKKNKSFCIMGVLLMGIGVFSSMSSGPMLAALLAGVFMASYRYRKYWKPVVIVVIIMCSVVEVISNRHFYDVLGGFTLSPGTAWYRSKLIDVALFEGGMSGHWLTGYGFDADPGWSEKIDGRSHTDMVNHYLLVLSRYGLWGLVPFFLVNVAFIKRLIEGYRNSPAESDRWLVWCLAASLFGLWGALVSVSLFGQPTTIYYIILGFGGNMPVIIKQIHSKEKGRRRRPRNGPVGNPLPSEPRSLAPIRRLFRLA